MDFKKATKEVDIISELSYRLTRAVFFAFAEKRLG